MSNLIERQAAIDAIERHLHMVLDGTHYDEGIAFGYEAAHMHIIDLIHELPSAQRKGKWMRITDEVFADRFECSECGKNPPIENSEWWLSDFCPNCGAFMKGDSDGEIH